MSDVTNQNPATSFWTTMISALSADTERNSGAASAAIFTRGHALMRSIHRGLCRIVESVPQGAGLRVGLEPPRWNDVIRQKRSHGYDRFYARRLYNELRAHGFTELATEGRVAVTPGGSSAAMFYWLSTQQMRERLVADGRVSDQEVDAYCALLTDPSHVFMWPTMLATRGRKPEYS